MRAELCGVTVDCRSVEAVAGFWSALLGLPLRESLPGWLRLGPVSDGGPVLTFQPVPEAAQGKVRLHLDVCTDDVDAAVAEVERLGGSSSGVRHVYDEGVVAVVADPEGHAFCLVQHHVPPA